MRKINIEQYQENERKNVCCFKALDEKYKKPQRLRGGKPVLKSFNRGFNEPEKRVF